MSSENENLKIELEKARLENHKKSDFLNRMSHEIRTPLNAIIGLSYLSRENESMPSKVYENLDKIEKSAHFLLSFVNDILSLSDLESGTIALEYDAYELREYFQSLVTKLEKKAQEKQIQFQGLVAEEIKGYYVFDEKLFSKIFFHLMENAYKTTPAGGCISFSAKVLSDAEDTTTFQFDFSDNGIGIEEGNLAKIFEPFEQVYGDNRTIYSGSGLELAITKNIVDLLHGEIHVDSKKGKGTHFQVTLSLKKEQRKEKRMAKEEKEIHAFDFSGKRALIVEDSSINIEIAKNILKYKKFDVEVAVNGEEAVAAFLKHEPFYYDVILMDIRMPVLDGLEATKIIRQMKERPDGKEIPIVAMTANAFEEDVKKSLEAGMNGHLNKPIDILKMYKLLEQVMSTNQ